MATSQGVIRVGKDLADVVGLVVDETPDSEQLMSYFKEGSEFSRGLFGLASEEIPEEKRAAVLLHLARGFLEGITEHVEQYKLPSE